MTTYETNIVKQGDYGFGQYYYDFFDHTGKLWRIISNNRPKDIRRLRIITGKLTDKIIPLRETNIFLPRISVFLGALVAGSIERGDIKIKEEQ